MSWSRSSRLGLVVLLLVAVAAVGVVTGVSVTDESVPAEAEAGQQVTVQVELQDLYAEQGSWAFDGRTALRNATWTIDQYRGGTQVASDTVQGSGIPNDDRVQIDRNASDAPDRLVIEITGTVPPVEQFSYDDPATFTGAEFARVGSSGAVIIQEWQIHHYTTGDPGSREARAALDDANATIQSAADDGNDVSRARSTFEEAVTAYDGGSFAEAVRLAEDAAAAAESGSTDSDDGSTDDGSSGDGTDDGGSADAAATNDTDGSGSGDGTGTGGSDTNDTQADGGDSGDGTQGTDDASGSDSTDASESDSDDGGLLMPILYGLLGAAILGVIVGGYYWYQLRQQGPNRDPLG